MTARNHFIMGQSLAILVGGYGLANALSMTQVIVALCGVCIGTLLPDIDEPRSAIGRSLPLLSILISYDIKHRTLTHWLVTRLVVLILGVILLHGTIYALFTVALVFGMFVHDFGDLVTGGIRGYFWPLSSNQKMFRLGEIKVGSIQEEIITLPFSILLLYEVFLALQVWRFIP